VPAGLLPSPIFGYLIRSPKRFGSSRSAMARGIHLKQLRTADLEAIGVTDDALLERADGEGQRESNLLAEADPALARTIDEVRHGLEIALQLLDEALAADNRIQPAPAVSEKRNT